MSGLGDDRDGLVSWHLLRFSRTGSARYLSHLDTARALQRTFARAGVPIALSRGMRPKPHLSLVLPLPVGAAGLSELAVVELVDPNERDGEEPGRDESGDSRDATSGDVSAKMANDAPAEAGDRLARLRAAAPEGIGIEALEPAAARPRPVAVSADYECELAVEPERLAPVVAWFKAEEEVRLQRTSPKGTKTIDVRRYVRGPSLKRSGHGSRLSFTVRYDATGAARPEEFVRLLAEKAGADPVMRDLVRMRVAYKESRGSTPRG